MGKRKSPMSKLMAQPRKAQKLDTRFTCPFCNNPATVECAIDRKLVIADASCFVCKETYSTTAKALTEPVDVYGEWIDECERVNKGVVLPRRVTPLRMTTKTVATTARRMRGRVAA